MDDGNKQISSQQRRQFLVRNASRLQPLDEGGGDKDQARTRLS